MFTTKYSNKTLRKDATASTINCKKVPGGAVFQKWQISQYSGNA